MKNIHRLLLYILIIAITFISTNLLIGWLVYDYLWFFKGYRLGMFYYLTFVLTACAVIIIIIDNELDFT